LPPGHSNGARVAATLAAELHAEGGAGGAGGAGGGSAPAGCVLFSYPLHAPGNISKLRDAEVLALPSANSRQALIPSARHVINRVLDPRFSS
jgi:predicted alpha/beta-hydrolase family hydrolase